MHKTIKMAALAATFGVLAIAPSAHAGGIIGANGTSFNGIDINSIDPNSVDPNAVDPNAIDPNSLALNNQSTVTIDLGSISTEALLIQQPPNKE